MKWKCIASSNIIFFSFFFVSRPKLMSLT